MTFIQETINLMKARGIDMIPTKDVQLHTPYISLGLNKQCFPCVTDVQYHFIDRENNKCEIYDAEDNIIIINLDLEEECYDVKYRKDLHECCKEVYANWLKKSFN